MVNLVEDGIDLAVRIGHLATPAWLRATSARCGGIVVASSGYLKQRGEPSTPEAVASHETIQFGAMTASPDWRFVEDGREIRVACTPRFATNSADAAIQYAEQDGGLTRVLAYQAPTPSKAAGSGWCWRNSSSRRLPIHIVYPTFAAALGQGAHFIDLVTDISDWHFGGHDLSLLLRHTRNVALARAMTTSSALLNIAQSRSCYRS